MDTNEYRRQTSLPFISTPKPGSQPYVSLTQTFTLALTLTLTLTLTLDNPNPNPDPNHCSIWRTPWVSCCEQPSAGMSNLNPYPGPSASVFGWTNRQRFWLDLGPKGWR